MKKLGKFYLPVSLIKDNPALVFSILSTVIVVRAEQLWERDRIEYMAISHGFDMLSAGATTPEYIFIAENGFIRWQKISIG